MLSGRWEDTSECRSSESKAPPAHFPEVEVSAPGAVFILCRLPDGAEFFVLPNTKFDLRYEFRRLNIGKDTLRTEHFANVHARPSYCVVQGHYFM